MSKLSSSLALSELAAEQLNIEFLNTFEEYKEYDEELKSKMASFLNTDRIDEIKDESLKKLGLFQNKRI